jgi:hypothetical protein
MPLILAIEPDKRQAAQLKVLVKNRLHADLVLADTTELALEAIGDRIPDLVLVPALLSPEEDGALNQALRVIAHAAHVQTLTIPVFASASSKKTPAKSGGFLSKLLPGKSEGVPEGCDPAVFGDQIAAYLSEIAAERDARGLGDDDFEDDVPAKPAASFARVETFAPPPRTFDQAVEDFKSDETATDDAFQTAAVEETPAAVEEPAVEEAPPQSLFREPEEEPVAEPTPERKHVFDSLFKRRERKPVAAPAESDWPVYQPPAEPVEEPAPEPAARPDDDWAPPKDQSIGVDWPLAADAEQPEIAAAPQTIERVDPNEEAVWQDHESRTDATWPLPPLNLTPPSPSKRPAPPDLLAEFNADLEAARPAPKPAAPPPQRPAPPPKPPIAAQAAPPKAQPKAQPAATPPAAPATRPPARAAAPKPSASTVFKSKKERPEWSALIDSLRQDMERMRHDRDDRSKPAEPVAEPPPARPAPEPVRYAAPPAPKPMTPEPPPAPPAARAPERAPVAPPKRPQKKVPVQDEWGFFDPQQCGFAALLAKLDEISDNEEKPA